MKRNVIKTMSLIIIPILAVSATVITVSAMWKDSIKNSSIEVNQRLYTIQFSNNGNQYCAPYEGLELNSGFEMPIISSSSFSGWGPTNSSGTGPAYKGYHVLSDFYKDINVETRTLTLYAKYNVPTINQITYSITDLPLWIRNDDCVTLAWVWSPNDVGSWHFLNFNSNTSGTIKTDEELTGFKLVRCIKGTTIPQWELYEDIPGRIYDETGNITCYSGTYSYSCSSWSKH